MSMYAASKRVGRLEEKFRAATAAMHVLDRASPLEKIKEWIAEAGVEQGPGESLAHTAARALGMTLREFREEVQHRAGL